MLTIEYLLNTLCVFAASYQIRNVVAHWLPFALSIKSFTCLWVDSQDLLLVRVIIAWVLKGRVCLSHLRIRLLS